MAITEYEVQPLFAEPFFRTNIGHAISAVQEALDFYANDVMGIIQKLYVTQSWTLVNNSNIGMHGHSHSNSLISGSLYFCELPTPVSSMLFDRHNTYQLL